MRKITVLIGVMILIAQIPVYAAGWSGKVKIKSIEVSKIAAEGVWISFNKRPFDPYPCLSLANQYLLGGVMDSANQNSINQLTSVAMTALLYDRNVTVYWDGTCSGGYAVLRGLTVPNITSGTPNVSD